MKLLAIDTATELCSAALWLDGTLSTREEMRPRGHGELILPMIEQLLADAAIVLTQLDSIAFGRGPGAFTGVRLAVSIAQGLGFSAGLPLIGISELRAVAAQALLQSEAADRVIVCQDARMDEVYWGCYERREVLGQLIGAEAVGPPADVALPRAWRGLPLIGAGTGFGIYEQGLAQILGELAASYPHMRPRAREVALLAAIEGNVAAVAPEMAQPVYLRDEVVSQPNQELRPAQSRN